MPAASPTLGLTHLQFEALLCAARNAGDRHDFALMAKLGLLGLRIFEAAAADIADLGEQHGHRVLRVVGKGTNVVLVPLPRPWAGPSTRPSPIDATARSCATAAGGGWTGTPLPGGSFGT